MKKLLFALVAALSLTLTSCGVSNQSASNLNVANTEVVLASKNYKVIGEVRGESKQNYWFCFGGLSRKSMSQSALADMYRNAGMEGKSRAVINVSVAYKTKLILIHGQANCIATGTLIEFTD